MLENVYENAFNAIKFVYLNRLRYELIHILDDFQDLDLQKTKLVWEVGFRKKIITINDFPVASRKKQSVFIKVSNMMELLKIIKENDIEEIEIFDCKTRCTRKLPHPWDNPNIKLHSSCKFLEPKKNVYKVSWIDCVMAKY